MSGNLTGARTLRSLCQALLVATTLVLSAPSDMAQSDDTVEVTVPVVAVYAGMLLGDLALGKRSFPRAAIQQPSLYATRDTAVGKLARRTLLPGQPIPLDALRVPPIISGGQSVRIVYQSRGLRITGEGVAQHAAGLSETLSVRSGQSGTLVRGRVISPRDIVVEDEP